MKKLTLLTLAFVMCTACVCESIARHHKGGGFKRGMGGSKMMRNPKMPYEFFERKGLFATGLKPVFPENIQCPPISSPYGSKTRYDGSSRRNPHYGYHNGMDITLDTGTPLLAVANGSVIHKGTAGRLVGNYIWLHFPKSSTGLPIQIFARYQHLDSPTTLNIGDQVSVGQVVGLSGNTGTTGGHFGSSGYPHLHIMFLTGDSPRYKIKNAKIGPRKLKYLDPMGLYVSHIKKTVSNHILRDLPDAKKQLSIPVRVKGGGLIPSSTKIVWPVFCQPK